MSHSTSGTATQPRYRVPRTPRGGTFRGALASKSSRTPRSALLAAAALAPTVLSCREDVSLGSWNTAFVPVTTQAETPTVVASQPPPAMEAGAPQPTVEPPPIVEAGTIPTGSAVRDAEPSTMAEADAPASRPSFPECNAEGEPGRFNLPGAAFGSTEVATDWTWADPVDSMQWDLMIERDVPQQPPGSPDTGYYWQQHINFVQGVAGRLGLQAGGVYQVDDPPVFELTKIAVFWLSGPPLDAELGDIDFPDARIDDITAVGATWTTIHARFDWQPCHVYRLRFAPAGDDPEREGIWYGAWITDLTNDDEVFLGRMLLADEVGLLSPFTTSSTAPFSFDTLDACTDVYPMSAIFGAPSTVDGSHAELRSNRFVTPLRCGTSRFTEFPGAVRHEAGQSP